MPSQKSRSKDDTWTTDELSRALNKTGERRHHRDKDEDRKRDRINGEEKHKRHRDEDSDRKRRPRDDEEDHRDRLTEEERERLRQERRQKREGKDGGREQKTKEEVKFRGKAEHREIALEEVDDGDVRERRHHGDRDRKHKDDDRHRDVRDKERRHKDGDRDRRRGRDDAGDEEADRERRREERRRQKEEEERARKGEKSSRHKDREERSDRHKDRDRDDRHRDKEERHRDKDRDREERHRDRDDKYRSKDKDERHRNREDRHKESEKEKEERREREREERKKEREEKHKSKDSSKSKSNKEEKEEENQDDDDGGYDYEEDFEDYEEDFEEDDDDDDGDKEEKKPSKYGRVQHNDELNDVLRALDEENERLLNSSSKSPVGSASYSRSEQNRSRQRYGEDQESDSDGGLQQAYQPRSDRPKTAINFVSAKQRAINRKTASKTMQRGHDLLKMIELDYASFDILDLPPVGEYDMYIRAFGSTGTRQVYVQTNDDNIDRDIQTEEVDVRQKWTQYPPEDFAGCGRGDGEKDVDDEEESQLKQQKEHDTGRLNTFLQKAGQVIAILLEEEKVEEGGAQSRSHTHLTISEGYTQLTGLSILNDRHVVYTHFSPTQPNLLLTIYSQATQVLDENPVTKRGIICVWNTNEPSYPQKILACSSEPRCCCFSPAKPSLVFAGMVDGSIAMWDLREPATLHQPTPINKELYSLRYPTYDTAGILPEENHHSPVSAILPVYSYTTSSKQDSSTSDASEESSSGLSFQLVSTEEAAVLNFWVVAELTQVDPAGSPTDLGLAPGACVKLLRSSSLAIEDPSRDASLKAGLRVLDMRLSPNDPNQFYLATDLGKVIHGMRFGKRAFPRAHSPMIETITDVLSIDFSPFGEPCFLVGCSDGSFSIYHTRTENPLVTWSHVTKGRAAQTVIWSRSRPCVFYVLDAAATLYIFDLLEGDNSPKHVENISKLKVTSLNLTNDHKADGLGPTNKDAQILFSLADGTTEIHTIAKDLREPQDLERDFLASYLQRF